MTPLPPRLEETSGGLRVRFRPFQALRESFAGGYSSATFRADLMAGIVVGVVALPLSMALAIATGVPPQHGLYTAIVAGFVTAALGGSRIQVSGPTAAFVVILVPIVVKFGPSGLLVATAMAGLILLLMGLFGLGKLIEFIPHPVTTGFTAGIAVVIATFQVKDFLGLPITSLPEHFVDKILLIISEATRLRWPDMVVGLATLATLIAFPRITKRVPAALAALPLAIGVAWLLRHLVVGADVATIGSRFSYAAGGAVHPGIPPLPPLPILPWQVAGPGGVHQALSFDMVRDLMPSAFAIAMLGAIESLLSAVVADGMAGTRHDPDSELVGQGAANLIAPFFGGFASTGAIARTATNIRAGGRTPVSAMVHALFVLAGVLLLSPWLALLPMSALAALLLVVAWNMSDARHFVYVLKVAPRSDVAVLLTCFGLTVFFDMVVAVGVGVMLAAALFLKQMSELTGARLVEEHHLDRRTPLPAGVVLYEVSGPLFFGAASRAMESLHQVSGDVRIVILDLEGVPVMDASGLVGFESALSRLAADRETVILAGVQPQPKALMEKAGIVADEDKLVFVDDVEGAIKAAGDRFLKDLSGDKLRSVAGGPDQPKRA